MLDGIIRGKSVRPRRVLLYGTHGIGKSTWAARSPNPLVIATEDGLDDIGVDRTPLIQQTVEVARFLLELSGEEKHPYKTVVIDTLDWLEKLIWKATCADAGVKTIDDIGYGKGYSKAARRWETLLGMLGSCREKGMNVILLAHARIEKFTPPDSDPYDRWVPDLHKSASPLIQEWCDEVLFATQKVSTISTDAGFGKKQTRALDIADRVVMTLGSPTHAAKRRIELPDEIALDWQAYYSYWPGANAKTNVNGVVVDGSSKRRK